MRIKKLLSAVSLVLVSISLLTSAASAATFKPPAPFSQGLNFNGSIFTSNTWVGAPHAAVDVTVTMAALDPNGFKDLGCDHSNPIYLYFLQAKIKGNWVTMGTQWGMANKNDGKNHKSSIKLAGKNIVANNHHLFNLGAPNKTYPYRVQIIENLETTTSCISGSIAVNPEAHRSF